MIVVPIRGATSWAVGLCSAYLLWKNVQLEAGIRTPNLGLASSLIHTLIYTLRLLLRVFAQRVLGLLPGTVMTREWTVSEEVFVRAINFLFKVSSGPTTDAIFAVQEAQYRFLLTNVLGKLHVEDIPSEKLGFKTDDARSRFGNLECTALWLTLPQGPNAKPIRFGEDKDMLVFYYVHGGGFCFGSAGMYLPACQRLLELFKREYNITKVGILSIEYPLAPKVKHPLPMDMTFHCLEHIVQANYVSANRLIVSGDSAGGSLALNLAIRGKPLGVAAACLFSPWLAHALDKPSYSEFADVDLIGGEYFLENLQDTYVLGGKHKALLESNLDVMGKNQPFAELIPPVWVCYGGLEILRDDIRTFIAELEDCKAEVKVCFGENAPHDFAMLWPNFPEKSEMALKSCVNFCAEQWAAAS